MTYKIYLPFVHGSPPKQYRLVGTLEEIAGDMLDMGKINDGASIDIGFVTSATVKVNDKFSIGIAVIQNRS